MIIINRKMKLSLSIILSISQNIICVIGFYTTFCFLFILNILITRHFVKQSQGYRIKNGSFSRTSFAANQEKRLLCQNTIRKYYLSIFNRIKVLYYQSFNPHNKSLNYFITSSHTSLNIAFISSGISISYFFLNTEQPKSYGDMDLKSSKVIITLSLSELSILGI